jgi:hypothetical protein
MPCASSLRRPNARTTSLALNPGRKRAQLLAPSGEEAIVRCCPASTLEEFVIDGAVVLGLVGLVTTLAGTLGGAHVAGRAQHELSRRSELRSMLDNAAERLAAAEAAGRAAWRILLDLDLRSAKEFDDVMRDDLDSWGFPHAHHPAASDAVDDFAAQVDELAAFVGRLELRLRHGHPAVEAFASACDRLSSVATTMAFAAAGTIGGGGDDLRDCLERFYLGLRDKETFLAEARSFVA